MKKTKLLFLLTPSLFLITSCGPTAPRVDGISEAEAREFIDKNFTRDPSGLKSGKVSWSIKDNAKQEEAKNIVKGYVGEAITDLKSPKGGKAILSTRISDYIDGDLESADKIGTLGTDAVAWMNHDIFDLLFASTQNEPDCHLTYKKEGKGLIIKSIDDTAKYTRTHTYDGKGRETKFSVDANKNNLVFTVSISFSY